MGQVQDKRTEEQKATTIGFVNATDSALSGWGNASGGLSYYCIACSSQEQIEAVKRWFAQREDMKRVAEPLRPRRRDDSHTSIIHFEETAARHF